jgi:UDPglucose 6-dehydrogenase
MDRGTSSTVYSGEDNILDASTAPTTPDGSLTFSPSLRALRIQDALEEAVPRNGMGNECLNTTLDSDSRVNNVCCIGAGYVGT